MRSQFALGRLLCGIACGALEPRWGARSLNLRKGAALLLRAADAGEVRAWIHLHRLSSDHRCSVANPQMARFFLEKAAAKGDAESQRRLGALLLREVSTIEDSEQALSWLHRAARHGDLHAVRLLQSLVLPVPGGDAEAREATAVIGRSSPWLAARLEVSRHFGLTRLEALAMDPAQGLRPWGLVVGPNLFVRKVRLAAPRASSPRRIATTGLVIARVPCVTSARSMASTTRFSSRRPRPMRWPRCDRARAGRSSNATCCAAPCS